ncbi:MAG: tRNA dihydrouridine synthase DusB [Treponema sp.]|jgi:nifR3 family TIM-barrel protein|nr:tRNA dihydrouridine synthase DusB [Treponema sp.]
MSLYRSVKIGSLELDGNLFLAPVAGYTDRAFRSLCAEEGACFSFTELVSAEALYRSCGRYGLGETTGSTAAANLVRRGEKEKRYAIQLFGAQSESVYRAAALLSPLRPDALDINAGCPVPKVVKNGAGSALMKNPANLGKVVEAAVRASCESLGSVPVTVKIRSGWDSVSLNYAECARVAVEAGAQMVSLHPRTRAQNYGGKSDWSHIADLVSRLSVPVTGSGDLYTPEDALQMLKETGCTAVMFARGAMGNPFIFSAARSLLETGAWQSTPFSARIAVALRHLEMLSADIGERAACLEMRKQFCAYTKGFRGGAALRDKAVHAETIAEYRKIVEEAVGKSPDL